MEKYHKILLSFVIGLLIPMSVLNIGLRVTPRETTAPTAETSPTDSTAPAKISKIQVLLDSGQTVQMELNDYLVGVILAEMSTSFESAALQAQAVVARTYTLKRQQDLRHPEGAVCTDFGCCQAYISQENYLDGNGYPQDIEAARSAVETTEDLVVTYDNQVIEATYFHSSGGTTEDAVAVWGVDYPYLQSVDSPGEEEMEHYSQEVYYDRQTLESLLGVTLRGTPDSWIGWKTYTVGGGVDTMYFGGTKYTGTELRSLLKLNSTAFYMDAVEDGIRITALGKGHRVGMSQMGAQAMAMRGNSWQEILLHYYPGTRIDKLEDVR